MSITICPLVSGSGGNSTYIGTAQTHLLIDAGISGSKIAALLSGIGIMPETLDALFITHEHDDHIAGIGVLSRRFNVPIYATADVWKALDEKDLIGKIQPCNRHIIYAHEPITVNDIIVTPFPIPHDAVAPVGYTAAAGNKKVAVATDIGCATDIIRQNLKSCNAILLESNHDVNMLKSGSYPAYLKRRVLSETGHLSNDACANLLVDIISPQLKHLFLGHLSTQNNIPELALKTVCNTLKQHHIHPQKDVTITPANPCAVSTSIAL